MDNVSNQKVNHNLVFVLYYIFKITPVIVSGMTIYLGYRLFILGVTGQASLSVESKTVQGQLINAAPGLFFAVGGLVTIAISVWKGVEIRFGEEQNPPRSGGRSATSRGSSISQMDIRAG